MNIKLTILILFLHWPAAGLLFAQVPHVINYQSTVARGGTNYHGLGHFKFALLDPEATRSYWSNDGTSVAASEPQAGVRVEVANGQYEVLLGDTTLTNMIPIPVSVFANAGVHIRVWFSDGILPYQPVLPDQPIAAVGYAMMAANVTDGAVTSTKLANGAVTTDKIAPQTITAAQLAPNAVTTGSITPGSIGQDQLAPNAAAANLHASGGLILSDQAKPTNLLAAGFTKIGTVMSDGDQWQIIGQFTPEPRYSHVAVWTGTEMIIWGGSISSGSSLSGGRFDPSTDTWKPMPAPSTYSGGVVFKAVWTGTEMVVLYTSGSGAVYNPATDTWRRLFRSMLVPKFNSPCLIWTGTEMCIWGGNGLGNGYRYNPANDSWKVMTMAGSPTNLTSYSAIWTGYEMIVCGMITNGGTRMAGARYNPITDTWTAIATNNAPSSRSGASAVWTGKAMIIWGGIPSSSTVTDTGVAYEPATDTWKPIATINQPSGRRNHTAFWTGSEMIIWGGLALDDSAGYLNTGGRYDPKTGTWQSLAVTGTPEALRDYSAVWAGDQMIIWGGRTIDPSNRNQLNYILSNAGAEYRPDPDQWAPIFGTPVGRVGHSMVWTGSELIVWGGQYSQSAKGNLRSGARFNPTTRHWSSVSLENAPSARVNHQVVWTGTEMIIWGGDGYTPNPTYTWQAYYGSLNTGARYNPATDSWTAMDSTVAPIGRTSHTMIWTGTEAIIFGGYQYTENGLFDYLDSGARYNPQTDSWASLSRLQAPSARRNQVAVWTDKEMVIWGGTGYTNGANPGLLATGARYNPALNTWTPMAISGAPRPSLYKTAVWTGQDMIVFTGARGARYNPATDRWAQISPTGSPTASSSIASMWTGQEMLVWGGLTPYVGARYNPQSDVWSAMTVMNAAEARQSSTAMWTGNSMLVFGGTEISSGALPDTVFAYSLTRPLYLYRHP